MDLRLTESIWLSTRTASELIAMIRAQREWDDTAAINLDRAITAMVGAALARRAPDLDELEDFQSLLRAAKQCLPAEAPASGRYTARWDSLSDCLSIRAELMVHGSYDAIKHMRHAPEIVQALRAAGASGSAQSELQKQFDLQPANLTRILNILENHRVVMREREGKEKRVWLGLNAPVEGNRLFGNQSGLLIGSVKQVPRRQRIVVRLRLTQNRQAVPASETQETAPLLRENRP